MLTRCAAAALLTLSPVSAALFSSMARRVAPLYAGAAAGKASAAVIVLHGLGDTAHGWEDIAAGPLAAALPHVRFILPTAPTQPVTINGGASMPSWYDIRSLSAHRELETCEGIAESEATVRALAADAGVPASRVALVGFSQGGALTLYTALRAPGAPFAAAAVLSGYMPLPAQIAPSPAVLAGTPLLLCHGDRDAVVPLAYGRDAAERARALGVAALTFKTYAGMGHGAGDEELRDLIAFLRKHLPPLPPAAAAAAAQ